MKVLGVAPCWDEATEYSYKWYGRLRKAVKSKIELAELQKEDATRVKFEVELEKKPDAVVFYDHGSEDCLVAQGGGECVLDTKNVDKVAGKVIYTMACLSAKKLGVEAWKRGCVYVGYYEKFTFTTHDEQLFCTAANSGFIAYANGEVDWAKVKQTMVEAFNKAIDEAEDPWSKMWLRYDRDILRVYAPGADTPETGCLLRRLAIRLWGPKVGWMLTRKFLFTIALFFSGFGIALHDACHHMYEIGGYGEILSPQGIYLGFALMVFSFLYATWQCMWMLKV